MILLRRLLGDVLRRQRQRQGRTLREVSSSARVSLGYLSEVERGQKEASSELLSAICDALDVRMSELMREVSDELALAELAQSAAATPQRACAGAGSPDAGFRLRDRCATGTGDHQGARRSGGRRRRVTARVYSRTRAPTGALEEVCEAPAGFLRVYLEQARIGVFVQFGRSDACRVRACAVGAPCRE